MKEAESLFLGSEPPVTQEEYERWWKWTTARRRAARKILARIVPLEPYADPSSYEEWCKGGRKDEEAIRRAVREPRSSRPVN
jgi:hypothetical protein